jgi:RNA polymerase sigma factor (TIGR02999 family)
MGVGPGNITQLLTKLTNGDREAESVLVPLVYGELKRLARRYMRLERPDHTLQGTALVHEAYLKLIDQRDVTWQNRAHFFGVAAQVMRHILTDHARARLAHKRGGAQQKISLDLALGFSPQQSKQLLELHEALERLSQLDPRQDRIVELKFFGGLTDEEVAEVLGISVRTAKRDWSVAKAWLYRELSR